MKKDDVKIIILILLIFIGVIYLTHLFNKKCYSMIKLKGNKMVVLKDNEKYKEEGYTILDSCNHERYYDIDIKNNIDYDNPGTYEITYSFKNELNELVIAKRFVVVTKSNYTYKDSYDDIDSKVRSWGIKNEKDGTRPVEVNNYQAILKKYNAYLVGDDRKVLYLTFDEGSNDTYLKEIVDVLNKNDVDATFFLCKGYMVSNKDLVKSMVKSGHVIGNHTVNHHQMTQYANRENYQKFVSEIVDFEKAYMDIIGKPLEKLYREPKGEYSYRSLMLAKDLGYRIFFWSATYLDFMGDVSKEKALSELTSRVHNGAIYLMHPKNKGNYEALDDFIKIMKKKGYKFDLVKNIK